MGVVRYLLLALFLTGQALAAGDFTFDVAVSGDSNWVKVPDNAAYHLTSTASISSWHRTSVVATQHVTCRQDLVVGANWRLFCTTLGFYTWTGQVGGFSTGVTTEDCDSGDEDHVIGLIQSPTAAQLAINGVVLSTDSTIPTPADPTVGPRIGGNTITTITTNDASSDHRGVIDIFRIFSRVLTDAERRKEACRNCRHRPVESLVGNWAMRGPSGTSMGSHVPDWSITQAHADGSAGTAPTYTDSYVRGVR